MPRKKKNEVAVVKASSVAVKEKDFNDVEVYRPTKADLFVDAFIRHRFNATQAALEVFDIKGDEAQRKNTAGAMGSEYLYKPSVQLKLKDRMARQDISVEYVLSRLKNREETTENEDVALRILDRLAHFVGAEIKERSTDVSAGRNPSLNLFMDLGNTARNEKGAIDVTPTT